MLSVNVSQKFFVIFVENENAKNGLLLKMQDCILKINDKFEVLLKIANLDTSDYLHRNKQLRYKIPNNKQ